MPKCCVCKSAWCGLNGVMCNNCWDWITEKMTVTDVAMVVAGIHHREPDNRHAREICYYLVGDNYTYGKSKLAQGNYRITVEKITPEQPALVDSKEINKTALSSSKPF